jgi:hypothetical protein
MSHQDRKSQQQIVVNHQVLREVFAWLLPPALFVGMHVRKGSTWKPRMLATAAILWAASCRATLGERFDHARKITGKIFCKQSAPGKTYEGFLKVLRRRHGELLQVVCGGLRARMKQELAGQFQVAGFPVFAADGSRVETPRTKSNQQAFSPRRKQKKSKPSRTHKAAKRNARAAKRRKQQSATSIKKKADMTQMWLTMLWNVGTGLPWAWRSGAADSSERHHLREMLGEMPENSLITADAGFMGYEFWQAILDANHNFVIRVGANVKLLKNLGYAREYDHTVYLWPDQAAKKKMSPLVLRLVVIHNGKHPVYLVTNLLSKQVLSDKQAIEIYRYRWGIELFFRTFKQTFGRTKLRSRSSENAELELDWSLVGLWAICLLGQCKLAQTGQSPTQLSAASAIKAVQTTMRDYRVRPESTDQMLSSMLASSLLDGYERNSSKTSRDYPRKKQRERVAQPKTVQATKAQIAIATEVKAINKDIRLAA